METAIDSLLDDIEKDHGGTRFRRDKFKAYLMVKNTPEAKP